jgi:N utilization substance protein A
MFDLKVMNAVLSELEETRGIPKAKLIEAIELSLATAYKKEFGKRGQIIRAHFDPASGKAEFYQIKRVVDESLVIIPKEGEDLSEVAIDPTDERVRYNQESHILIENARIIKKDVKLEEEIVFPLEDKDDFGRIAAQTAKQVIIQKLREAERVSVVGEYGAREGEIVTGTVQRAERGALFVDLGRATGVIPFEEQIRGERFKPGDSIRALLFKVEDSERGIHVRLSRSHPEFLAKLFALEVPEINQKLVEIKSIAREAGSRSKIAVKSNDSHIDPIGSLVGQSGVRVNVVISELGGEKIDIVEWSEDPKKLIEEALRPAKVLSVELDETSKSAKVTVDAEKQSLAIGKGGQNVRLAAKLTGWKIDILSSGPEVATLEVAAEPAN